MDNHMDMSHLQMPKHMAVPLQEEPSDLEELEQFAKAFKQRRIKLGFTQVRKDCFSKLSYWKLLIIYNYLIPLLTNLCVCVCVYIYGE